MSKRFHTQTILHGQIPGKQGNCTQAAIASFMGLPLNQVPDFNNDTSDEDTSVFWEAIQEWFKKNGWHFHWCSGITDHTGLYLASGPTTRGTRHMVVYRDGELFWDPHPSREGITHVDTTYKITPLDPARFMSPFPLKE